MINEKQRHSISWAASHSLSGVAFEICLGDTGRLVATKYTQTYTENVIYLDELYFLFLHGGIIFSGNFIYSSISQCQLLFDNK